jgi:tRNA pseudouridine55 synthase
MKSNVFCGFVLLHKPPGLTSFQALHKVKKIFGTKRVGHAGTLDSSAEGLLVVAIGKATRLLNFAEVAQKSYIFDLVLGEVTSTLDESGTIEEVDAQVAISGLELEKVLSQFVGKIQQLPPKYSARKFHGKRLSDWALQGVEVEVAPAEVEIFHLKLHPSFTGPSQVKRRHTLQCHCSKGTYMRSLAKDIGEQLHTVARAARIMRNGIGTWSLANAHMASQLEKHHLIQPHEFLHDLPRIYLGELESKRVRAGGWEVLPKTHLQPFFVLEAHTQKLICLAEPLKDRFNLIQLEELL